MAHIVNKGKGGEPNPLENHLLTSDGLKNKLAQLGAEHLFYELEAVEVMDTYRYVESGKEVINPEEGEKTVYSYNTSEPGVIVGRYVFSEHGNDPEELLEFFPLDANIIQVPVVGEVVLGFSDKATNTRYYFGKLNTSNKVTFNKFNISGVQDDSINDTDDIEGQPLLNSNVSQLEYKQGEHFEDSNRKRHRDGKRVREGDTLIQGRFGNHIQLGSNQKGGVYDSPNISLVANINRNYPEWNPTGSIIRMTTNEKVEYPEPTKTYGPAAHSVNTAGVDGSRGFSIDYDSPQIIFDSDRIVINSKKTEGHKRSGDIGIFADGKVFIKGRQVRIENAEMIELAFKEYAKNYTDGVIKDFSRELDADTKLLPANIIPYAEAVRPKVENIVQQVNTLAAKALPPVLAPGVVNPAHIFGFLSDLNFFKKRLPEIKDFFSMDWLDTSKWETVSLNDVRKALGLDNLSFDFPTDEWDKFFDDIDAMKENIENIKAQVKGQLAAIEALSAAFDAIMNGGGDVQTIVEQLDAYEADPNNKPIDTTDIRDVIADGADNNDLQRYLQFGGSPQVREALMEAQQAEQDLPKLDQLTKVVELVKLGENL